MPERAPRADALRNRAKILAAAGEAFARDGADVPLDTIARLAGVGPGTVHRHFPTKESLVAAVVTDRLDRLADQVERLHGDPAVDFFDFLAELAREARHNLMLTAALGGTLGSDGDQAARRLTGGLDVLLRAAQQAGAVRPDLSVVELHAVLGGALAIEQQLPAERQGLGLQIVLAGLRPADPGSPSGRPDSSSA
ncbi:TetR/AcrR family transcriptional regulator [Frankia sp. AgB1.9]|uniref:TetR/AcrR family transcriptional regulator n=1 Tax=unclassified Frankia TaxID=2632575 RepID=UPI0019312A0F|nr:MULTISPECIES: TetR/AcrR family transcriptional regulator [unclassified Frankia]MBL7491658.1 TetR/AcrR family transcriptional regulator [Frankia sp. AgW1.1]MBL7551623.1 TetR/AcrR family transcriptional regulator [Frankia sp. AgB1.9]MBL7624210.1 TetR/AcrR family transcriptional regulator [Frankia sp. AgB1.8]